MYVGIIRTAAATELVVWSQEVYPAQQTQPGSSQSAPESCPAAKKGPPTRRKPKTVDNKLATSIARARVFESHVLMFSPRVAVVRRRPYTKTCITEKISRTEHTRI